MRVLVAEDDECQAEAVAVGLVDHGYQLDVVNDGAEALRLALVESYDLVILDQRLPNVVGVAICEELPGAWKKRSDLDAHGGQHRGRSRRDP